MHALIKFRQYLVGNKFVVKIDHNNLRYFLTPKDLNERKQKWVSKTQSFEFYIEYVKGKNNVIADALSRRPSISLMDVAENWKDTLEVEYAKDKFSCEFFYGTNHDDMYKVLEGIINYKDRIYLVPNSSLKEEILKKARDSPLAGHPGFFKTYRMLRERFSWKGLKADDLKYLNEWPTCQQNKVEHTHPAGLLHPLPIPEQKWESISMDFIHWFAQGIW